MSTAEIAGWVPLVALLATLPVFAVLSRSRPIDPDVARRSSSLVLGYRLRDWLVWVISPVERYLVRSGVSPDALNYLGAALGLLAGIAFAVGALPLAAWLLALAGICDVLDGRIARARGIASSRGAFLDSTLDRFAEVFAFVGIAWYLAESPWMAGAAVLALGGSMLVSYVRARGEAVGVVCSSGIAQRAERIVVLAFAAFLDPTVTRLLDIRDGTVLAGAVVLIAIASLGTAVYRTIFISRGLASGAGGDPPESP